MKVFLDASYIIHLKYSQDDEIFEYCLDTFTKLANHEALVNIVVINEVVWILSRRYKIGQEEIFEFLDRILNFLTVVPLNEEDYQIMRDFMQKYRLKPSDSLILSSMKKSKCSLIISEDTDFDRVDWVKRVWVDREKLE